ncbi:MAG: choice-of-anchor tandem repeat NxxGxxAF-containing protein [Phycisphaerae bacterium]
MFSTQFARILGTGFALLTCLGAAAQVTVTFEQVAITGQPVPGRNPPLNSIFNGRATQTSGAGVLSKPTINNDGVIVFRGVGSAPGNFNANTTIGIYAWTPGGGIVEVVGEQYTNNVGATFAGITYPVPGRPAGTKFSNFSPPLLNDRGDVVFRATWGGPGGSGDGYYATTVTGGPIVKIVDTTDTVPSHSPTLFSSSGIGFGVTLPVESNNLYISLNDFGQVAFVAPFRRSTDVFIQYGVFGTTVAGGPAVRLADTTGTVNATNEPATLRYFDIQSTNGIALNNNGTVMFIGGTSAVASGAVRGVHIVPVDGSSLPTRLARGNLAAPLLRDGVARNYFTLFNGYDLNDEGDYVFHHQFSSGVGAVNALFGGKIPNPANLVLIDSIAPPAGLLVPGRLPTAKFNEITVSAINEEGQVGAPARDNSVANAQGIYGTDTSLIGPKLVAQTPAIPPGRLTGAFSGFDGRAAAINDLGNMVFAPSATDTFSGSPDQVFGLYFFDDCATTTSRLFDRDTSAPAPPVGLGDTFVNPGCGGSPCERDVRIWQGFETRSGHMRAINNSNDVAFFVAFSTFEVGIFVAHVQTTGGDVEITCPANAVVECPADITPAALGSATATGCGTITITHTDSTPVPACGTTYSLTRTWSATNGSTAATCDQLIDVVDTIAPVLVVPANTSISCAVSTDPATTGQATASDDCDTDVTVTYIDAETPGACPQQRIITRTWTATDDCDNSVSAVQVITVGDDNLAVLTLPADVTISCDESTLPANTGSATAVDGCDANPSVTYTDNVGAGECPGDSLIIRTWTATDACGNSVSLTQSITVIDDTPPVLTLPATATIECTVDRGPGSTGLATAIDSCDTAPVVAYADIILTGSCSGSLQIIRTWTATDACGNTTSQTQDVFIQDSVAPTLNLPAAATVECGDATDPSATGEATAGDACDLSPAISFSDAVTPGACGGSAVITRTWTASDACGNSVSGVQTITVQDSTAPALTLPAAATVECGGSTNPLDTGSATAVETCSTATVNYSDVTTPGDCPQESTITRTWTAVDECGNSSSGTQTINIVDTQPPSISVPAGATVECGEPTSPDVTGSATANDACEGAVTVSFSDATVPGSCGGTTNIIRTWTSVDACGNASSATQTISVVDGGAPVLTLPTDATVDCGGDTSTAATGVATASDGCDPAPSVTFADAETPGTCGTSRVITRTWTATDACNNTSSQAQLITVTDLTAPTLTLPANQTLECGDSTEPTATGTATATDACDASPTVSYSDTTVPGTCASSVIISRTWTATDACGNAASGVQTITLTDATAPLLTIPASVSVACGASTSPTNTGQATASDNCDATPAVAFSDVSNAGTCPVSHVISRTWTATDGCGNTISLVQTITVVDNTGPTFTVAPANLTVECDGMGNLVQIAAWLAAPQATDDCGSVTITNDYEGLCEGCGMTGSATVTWTAVDSCGNSTSRIATVQVTDTLAPSITCPPNVTVQTRPHQCSARGVRLGYPVTGDTCGAVTVCHNGPHVYPIGDTIVTWTATDECGNSSTCQQTVTVEDMQPPRIHCSLATTLLWPPNHDLVNVGLCVSVRDQCDSGLPATITVFSDEDDEEPTNPGIHSPDAKNVAAGTLRLRSERIGSENGRVYLIVVSATDSAGNEASSSCAVIVPKSRSVFAIWQALQQALCAQVYFELTGSPPPGFVPVGDGAVIGPKQ